MNPCDSEAEFLEELGNLLVDYPEIAVAFSLGGLDAAALEARAPRCVRWGKVPGQGWVCLEWSTQAEPWGPV